MASKTPKMTWKIESDAARTFLSQKSVERFVGSATDEVLKNAKRIATSEAFETGAYANSFTAEVTKDGYRPVGVISTDDHKWAWIEYGTRDRPGKRVIRRAVDESSSKRKGKR